MKPTCRCCLTNSTRRKYYSLMTILPEFARKKLSILDLISTVTSSKIELSNDFPVAICSECVRVLKLAYSFIVVFHNSHKTILEKIQRQDEEDKMVKENHDYEDVGKNLKEHLGEREEIIIITEEGNENSHLEKADSILDILDPEFTEKESNETEAILSDTSSIGAMEEYQESDSTEEFDMLEETDDVEKEQNVNLEEMKDKDIITKKISEKTEKNSGKDLIFITAEEDQRIIYDDDVDQEIIEMEEQICNNTEPTALTTLTCEFCDRSYKARRILIDHIKKKHPECAKEYMKKLNKIKEKILVKREFQTYICEECNKAFKSRSAYQTHKYNFHHPRGSEVYKCNTCSEVLPNRSALRYHKLAKHRGKDFPCEVCDKMFISKSNLRFHVAAVHQKSRPENYLCSICGRGFKYNTALKYHIGKAHTNKRDFVCRFCGASFILLGQLRLHEKGHSEERPYSCQYCEKTFKRGSMSKVHEKTHLGIYPLKCDYCDRVFTKRYNMYVHWLQHRGEYQCEVCPKAFADEDILKFHYKFHHKVKGDDIAKEADDEEDEAEYEIKDELDITYEDIN